MKKLFLLSLLAILILQSSCSSKKTEEKDPVAAIEALSKDVENNADDWDETAWNEAAERLETAISNLPEPLETKELSSLSSSYHTILNYASQHERKAAKMLEALNELSIKLGEKKKALEGTFELQGSVDKYPVTMHLVIEGESVKGSYYYNKFGPNALLTLSGKNDDGKLTVEESDERGKKSGHFEGEFSEGVFKGVFTDAKGKKMPFVIAEIGADISEVSLDDISIDDISMDNDMEDVSIDDDDTDEEETDVSSAYDIDDMLESYDQYVTKYIKYIKKAANGDASALMEYPGLMAQAQDLQEKLEQCKGHMSQSQMKRYLKITNRMIEAAK